MDVDVLNRGINEIAN